jgi:hypothetical protein
MASFSTSRPDTVLRLKIKKGKKDDAGTNNKSRGCTYQARIRTKQAQIRTKQNKAGFLRNYASLR